MLTKEKIRLIEIQIDGVWTPTEMGALERGDIIRLTDDNGQTFVKDKDGNTVFEVQDNPTIHVEPYKVEAAQK